MYYSIGGIEGFTKAFSENSEDSEDSGGLNKSVKDFELLRAAIGFPPIAEPVRCTMAIKYCTEDETPASTQPCPCRYGPKDPRRSGGKIIKSPNGETKVKLRSGEIVSLNPPRPAPSHGISNNTKLLAAVGSVAIGLYFFLK